MTFFNHSYVLLVFIWKSFCLYCGRAMERRRERQRNGRVRREQDIWWSI